MFFDSSPDIYPHVFSGSQWFIFILLLHKSKLKNVAVCLRRDSAGENSSTSPPPPQVRSSFCLHVFCVFLSHSGKSSGANTDKGTSRTTARSHDGTS